MCVECGVKPCKRGAIKYCSKECSLKNTSVHVLGNSYSLPKGHTPWNKNKKGIHLSKKSEFRKDNSVNLGRVRLDMRGENNHKWQPKLKRPCEYCTKELALAPHQVKNRVRNFCNRTCWALGTRGKGSPVYKGEKSARRLRNRVAQMPEYREWHATVLKRDGYKCVKCGAKHSKKTPLEVDHIKRFLFIANEYKIYTPEDARKCDELWDTKNGQTVCKPCHRTLQTYGTTGLRKTL